MEDSEDNRRRYQAPYTQNHPIPSIQRYAKAKEARREFAMHEDLSSDSPDLQAFDQDDTIEDDDDEDDDQQDNGNDNDGENAQDGTNDVGNSDSEGIKDTSEAQTTTVKDRRKEMSKMNRLGKLGKKSNKAERIDRIVTDPVTHLPVRIHDFTSKALKSVDKNEPAYGTTPWTATGLANKEKDSDQLKAELEHITKGQEILNSQFPPPDYQSVHNELLTTSTWAVTIAVATFVALQIGTEVSKQYFPDFVQNVLITSASSIVLGAPLIYLLKGWVNYRFQSIWEGAIWHTKFDDDSKKAKKHNSETTLWLNSLLASVWPLINPDLFTSLADTLEDVMQASLPSVVRMVSVDDIGQGSEAIRILGVRWLPTGAAGRAVDADGNLKKTAENKDDGSAQPESEEKSTSAMEADEGDFINLEIAYAYRASSSGHTFKERMKDMHLNLGFYLPGNIKLPIWVDLRGAVGVMRVRLQLAPDPPFFSICTLTLLGQPKVELACVPLMKKGLNIMNIPLISNFVQSSIDAAMAEYVAPKSLTLNLKDMISGDDFKKDVVAEGVLVVTIIRGHDFKIGDVGIPLIKDGSADPYVTLSWAKFGKPLWSTRILENEMQPIWYETAFALVTPQELDVDERLRLQLWDSDRFTADDDLGRIEVDLKQLINGEANGKMIDKSDGFRALKAGEEMPGQLEWRVGYFPKLGIQPDQLEKQDFDKETRSVDELQKKVKDISARKLRETEVKKGNKKTKAELRKQRELEFAEHEHEMMISAPPPDGYPSGIFSIQIHQITGLELQKLNKKEKSEQDNQISNEEEEGDLPSAYCTIIINHAKVYMTRTKPKNARPFYNAGTEKFVSDWRNTEVHISVRDGRVHEDDALLGIVHFPLSEVFKERSQINGFYPLAGGVGYGKIRVSMVWRSVKLQASPEMLGWDLGTLQVDGVKPLDLPDNLKNMKIKLQTSLGSAKMHSHDGEWQRKNKISLAVKERYSSCFTVRFRVKGITGSKTEAFSVLWLREIPDEEEQDLELPVWKGDFQKAIKSSVHDLGEQLGTIKVKLTFWPGLGPKHTAWAIKHDNMRDVVQVLETAHDNLEESKAERAAGIVDEDNDSDSDDSDSSDDDEKTDEKHEKKLEKKEKGDEERQEKENAPPRESDGETTHAIFAPIKDVIDEAKEYKDNYKSIHRRNRGVMTWKAPRTAQWAFHKAEKAEHKLAGIFKRHSRGVAIETEV